MRLVSIRADGRQADPAAWGQLPLALPLDILAA